MFLDAGIYYSIRLIENPRHAVVVLDKLGCGLSQALSCITFYWMAFPGVCSKAVNCHIVLVKINVPGSLLLLRSGHRGAPSPFSPFFSSHGKGTVC